jgi:hypothetical protein
MPDLSDSESEESEIDDDCGFFQFIEDTVVIGHRQGDTTDNLLMEIKGLKFAHNREFSDCVMGIAPSLLRFTIEQSNEAKSGSQMVRLVNAAKTMFGVGGWGFLLLKPLLQEVEDEIAVIRYTLSIDQLCFLGQLLLVTYFHFIRSIENEAVLDSSPLYGVFRLLLQVMYDAELLSEEALQLWVEERKEDDINSKVGKLFAEPQVQAFVEWLQEEDDDDEEEDDDEDNEEGEVGAD